jgi:hypothetical protein
VRFDRVWSIRDAILKWLYLKAIVDGSRHRPISRVTPKRRNLVDTLRGKMQDDGWTEFGVDGDWYEYTFGR